MSQVRSVTLTQESKAKLQRKLEAQLTEQVHTRMKILQLMSPGKVGMSPSTNATGS